MLKKWMLAALIALGSIGGAYGQGAKQLTTLNGTEPSKRKNVMPSAPVPP